MSSTLRGALTALSAFAVYSAHDVIVKDLGARYSSVQIVFFVGLFSLPLLAVMLRREGRGLSLRPRYPSLVLLRAIAGVGATLTAFYAFALLPMAQAYAFFFTTPLMITLLAIPLLGERVGWVRGFAVLLGLLGVLIVLRPGTASLGLGHVAAFASAFCSAIVSVIARKIAAKERPLVLILATMSLQVLAMGLALPLSYQPMPLSDVLRLMVIALLAVLAALLIILAYRQASAALVAPMQYSQLLWAVFYGWLFFGEHLDLVTGIGATIIVVSGLLVLWREGRIRAR